MLKFVSIHPGFFCQLHEAHEHGVAHPSFLSIVTEILQGKLKTMINLPLQVGRKLLQKSSF